MRQIGKGARGAFRYVNEAAIWEEWGSRKRGEGGRFVDRWVKSRGESLAIGICLIIVTGDVAS